MPVRVVSGSHDYSYEIVGSRVGQVRKSFRDVCNISPQHTAAVNGVECNDTAVLEEGDVLEFFCRFGRKRGLHDFWSIKEVTEFFGKAAIEEFQILNIQPVLEPVFTSEQIATWMAKRADVRNPIRQVREFIVDFQTMEIHNRSYGKHSIDDTRKFQLLKRLAQRPNIYVHFDALKRDVWGYEDTEDATVSREARRLRNSLTQKGVQRVRIETKRHRLALLLE